MKGTDKYYFEQAARQARKAKCHRAKCGSVIVSKSGEVIGKGYNAPPLNDETQCFCSAEFDFLVKPKYDKTCCVHAEWNAIIDALKKFGNKIAGGTLYFMRVDGDGEWTDAGLPYCSVCSRLAMQSGLKNFVLWVDDAPKFYGVADYNQKTYEAYKKEAR